MPSITSKKNINRLPVKKNEPESESDSEYNSESESESEGNGITDQEDPNFQWGIEGEQWEWVDESDESE